MSQLSKLVTFGPLLLNWGGPWVLFLLNGPMGQGPHVLAGGGKPVPGGIGGLGYLFVSGIGWGEGASFPSVPARDDWEGAESPQVVAAVTETTIEWVSLGHPSTIEQGGVCSWFEEVTDFGPCLIVFDKVAVYIYVVVSIVFTTSQFDCYLCDLHGVQEAIAFFLRRASSVGEGGSAGELCPVISGSEKGCGVFSQDGEFMGGGGWASFCWLDGLEIVFCTSSSSWFGLAFFWYCVFPGGGVVRSFSSLLVALFLFWACGPFSCTLGCVLVVRVSPCIGRGVL